ncbi:MAG: rRNA maturation RNase YbeY [Thermomicrobiales bacterium]
MTGLPPFELEFDLIEETDIPAGFSSEEAERMASFLLRLEGQTGSWSVAVALVDEARLQELHRDFMGIDEPTDVMTFPAETPGVGGGDIAISIDRAGEQGPEHGLTAAEETMFLIAHGLLHLCGWDDATPEDRAAMLDRQREVLSAFAAE